MAENDGWKSDPEIQMEIPEIFQRSSKPKQKCNCNHDCDKCHKQSHKKANKAMVALAILSLIFFWHELFLFILTQKRLQKELIKHPEKVVAKLFEAMLNGT